MAAAPEKIFREIRRHTDYGVHFPPVHHFRTFFHGRGIAGIKIVGAVHKRKHILHRGRRVFHDHRYRHIFHIQRQAVPDKKNEHDGNNDPDHQTAPVTDKLVIFLSHQ